MWANGVNRVVHIQAFYTNNSMVHKDRLPIN